MSTQPADANGRVPLILGVTGHRDLRVEDRPALEAGVRNFFQDLHRRYPHTPFVLLSPLAEGADRLVARVGLGEGVRLHVPLPVPREEYLTDFADAASRQEFDELAMQAEAVIVVAVASGADHDRPELYRRAGEFVAEHCQLLIALWDGEPSDMRGGTADIIRWRLSVLPRETSSLLHPPDPVHSGPVHHLPTARTSGPARPSAASRRYPDGAGPDAAAERTYEEMYRAIDEFNAAAGAVPAVETDASRRHLLPAAEAERLVGGLAVTRDAFAAADALAVRYRRRTHRTLTALYLLAFVAVAGYEVASHLLGWEGIGLILYPLLLAVAFALFARARAGRYQDRYHDYRALAEGLRVQFFWRLAGVTAPVEEHYLRRQRRELNWVRTALRVCWSLGGGRQTADGLPEGESDRRLRLAASNWVENQRAFFGRRAPREEGTERVVKLVITACLAVGVGLSLAVGVVLLFPSLFGHDFDYALEHNHAAKGGLLLATSLPLVAAALLHAYRQASALGSHVKQYEVMAHLFDHARERLDALGPTATAADVRRLIEELGREALVENGDWVLRNRDRPLEVPTGR